MEGAGAKPPPACRTPRTTARRPKRTARPTPRRARLGAPQNVAGSRATGTPADRQGPTTPAGRPTARQGRPGRPPRFCGGWRAPGPRAARELHGTGRTRRGRTPTKPPPHHTPPRGQRRGRTSRAIRIRGGADRPRPDCADWAAYLLRPGRRAGTTGRKAGRRPLWTLPQWAARKCGAETIPRRGSREAAAAAQAAAQAAGRRARPAISPDGIVPDHGPAHANAAAAGAVNTASLPTACRHPAERNIPLSAVW